MKIKASIRRSLIISLNLFLCSLFTQAQNTVINAGHLFDYKTGKMLSNQTIIIKDGKILEVGANLKYAATD